MVLSIEKRIDFLFWGMQKEKAYLMKIPDATNLIECIRSECVKIDDNVELLHRVHVNLAKGINFGITNDGKHFIS